VFKRTGYFVAGVAAATIVIILVSIFILHEADELLKRDAAGMMGALVSDAFYLCLLMGGLFLLFTAFLRQFFRPPVREGKWPAFFTGAFVTVVQAALTYGLRRFPESAKTYMTWVVLYPYFAPFFAALAMEFAEQGPVQAAKVAVKKR
jgi:uncharacterized BrkB/YihY/UPF0761 family membrane protein